MLNRAVQLYAEVWCGCWLYVWQRSKHVKQHKRACNMLRMVISTLTYIRLVDCMSTLKHKSAVVDSSVAERRQRVGTDFPQRVYDYYYVWNICGFGLCYIILHISERLNRAAQLCARPMRRASRRLFFVVLLLLVCLLVLLSVRSCCIIVYYRQWQGARSCVRQRARRRFRRRRRQEQAKTCEYMSNQLYTSNDKQHNIT